MRGKRGAFLCLVEIAASRFALLAMTKRGVPLSGRDCRVALCAPRNDNGRSRFSQ
ncbi:MAG: hypothetical protein LBL66_01925 [Clostridiales bacterium]|nr:hypothetical protein [Clostridiales bacterium]